MKKILKHIQIAHDVKNNEHYFIDGLNIKLLENNKIKDFVSLNKDNKSVIITKETGRYNPVSIAHNGTTQWLFKSYTAHRITFFIHAVFLFLLTFIYFRLSDEKNVSYFKN